MGYYLFLIYKIVGLLLSFVILSYSSEFCSLHYIFESSFLSVSLLLKIEQTIQMARLKNRHIQSQYIVFVIVFELCQ